MYAETISSHIIRWEKRIIYVYWIDAAISFSFYINTTSLDWNSHLTGIKYIPKKVEKIH